MREYSWHVRQASATHYRWFESLKDRHSLTRAWLRESQVRIQALLEASVAAEASDFPLALPFLEGTIETLPELFDDTSTEDLLLRLERLVEAVQSAALAELLKGTTPEALATISWKAGCDYGLAHSPKTGTHSEIDLRGALLAFRNSPWGSHPQHEPLLVKRATRAEVRIEWLSCPHHARDAEADTLCRLRHQWIQGFLDVLHPRIQVAYRAMGPMGPDASRCETEWALTARDNP